VEIEFDPGKDAINRQKHGLSLADAARLDIAAAFVVPDERRAYGEARLQAYGLIDGRLHVLAFTMRGDVLRAISLRKANSREVKRYG
jgi:uncharacterized DUF497 family protein